MIGPDAIEHEADVLSADIHRATIQDCAAAMLGWSFVLASAAERGSPADLLEMWRKAREAFLLARDEIRALEKRSGE